MVKWISRTNCIKQTRFEENRVQGEIRAHARKVLEGVPITLVVPLTRPSRSK
jgi:hypothetical protein